MKGKKNLSLKERFNSPIFLHEEPKELKLSSLSILIPQIPNESLTLSFLLFKKMKGFSYTSIRSKWLTIKRFIKCSF